MTSPVPDPSAVPDASALALDLDEKVLLRLFELAGSVQSIEILDRLILDLRAVLQVLQRFGTADLVQLRSQNHSLIGIAGTVGAVGLHRLALEAGRQLRASAAPQRASVQALLDPTERLIARLVEMRAQR